MTLTSDDRFSFGALLRTFRKRQHLTQQQLAEALGVHRSALIRWEQGDFLPEHKATVLELARLLHLEEDETRLLLEASLTALSPHWLVPLPRNPFFTGREELLSSLHAQLGIEHAVALTQSSALHGLGGVGKTQIALEYAYRYALDYSAVFWIGAETEEQVRAALLHIAAILQVPEREDKDQQRVIAAVQHWLSAHKQWLLIWDNVEALEVLDRFLPPVRSGALLITTRRQALGTFARSLDLLPMEQEEALLFLLRRARVLSSEATSEQVHQYAARMPEQYAAAVELVREVGGLPLALDQAGAYLEETRCGLPAYLDLFRSRRVAVLQRRGEGAHEHPASVATTFTLAMTATAECHPAARELLHVCALLQPDAIPEELFRQGGEQLGPILEAICGDALEWDHVVGVACSYSLLSRQPETQTLSLHRLVQAVLLDTMTEAEREQWSRRVIEALDAVFPRVLYITEYAVWKQCERLLSHTLLSLQRTGADAESLPLASLAHKIACYLLQRGQYAEVESFSQRALQIQERTLGAEHLDVAASLNNLATLYWKQGKYAEAETLYLRALQIRKQALGSEHLDVASSLNNLALIYTEQGKYAEAEPLHLRGLHICEQALGAEHPDVVISLSNLAVNYMEQGKYAEAEPLFLRALHIWEQALGPDHPDAAFWLCNLATLYFEQRQYAKVEALHLRALHLWEQALGPDHPQLAFPLTGLADLYREQGRDREAEVCYRRALASREQRLDALHPETAETLHGLVLLLQKQGHLSDAFSYAERALSIRVQSLGEEHPKTSATRTLYAQLDQKQADGAEPTLVQLRILLKARGWSLHLKKRRDKPYVYATRKVGTCTQSRYLAPLSNLAACLAAAGRLPNAREE